MELLTRAVEHQKNGEYEQAKSAYEQALQEDPHNVPILNALGGVVLKMRDFNKARNIFEKSLSIDPNNYYSSSNLGNLMNMEHRYEDALGCYKIALANTQDKTSIISNITNTFYMMGDFEKAIPYYQKILADDYSELSFIYNYVSALFSAGRSDEIGSEVERLIQEKQLSASEASGLHVKKATVDFIRGDMNTAKQMLENASEIPDNAPDALALKAYRLFLIRLLDYWDDKQISSFHPTTTPIYFLGDSHVLSAAHNQTKSHHCVALLNPGCKAWHLTRQINNQYKRTFEISLAEVPENSTIFFCFGEIDCHHTGGIFSNHKKHPEQNLHNEIEKLVNAYVDYVKNITSTKTLKIGFCGVPASNTPLNLSEEDTATFLSIIDSFNDALAQRAKVEKLPLINLYNAGTTNHIDAHHLTPNGFAKAAGKLLPS